MADSDFRICPACSSRNRGQGPFCVRCGASMSAVASFPGAPLASPRGRRRWTRFLVAAGVVLAVGVGYAARTVSQATEEVSALSDAVRADSAPIVDTPPPAVTGWYPGANLLEPAKEMPRRSAPVASVSGPSTGPNLYDVPGDPSASMVGIAPRAPRARPATAGKRVFTEEDLLATRGEASAPPPQQPQVTNDADDDDSDDDDDAADR
jgi:hypothetical protein